MAKPKAPKDMERPQRRADDLVGGFLLCPCAGDDHCESWPTGRTPSESSACFAVCGSVLIVIKG
jgi:hypothetical protein